MILICNSEANTEHNEQEFQIPNGSFNYISTEIDGIKNGMSYTNVNMTPVIRISFSAPVKKASVFDNVIFNQTNGSEVKYNVSFENKDSTLVIIPVFALKFITKYSVEILPKLISIQDIKLNVTYKLSILTKINTTHKFPLLSNDQLLTLVQRQTFKYFWDFGHPISGLARERSTSGDIITIGGSGFGVMTIITAIHREFITRTEGLTRIQKIVGFLKNAAQRFHGAFPHWLNGTTGSVIPFGKKDNGADLVETSYMMQGLLCARQYFNGTDESETVLRHDINALWNAVEWNWFRKNQELVLYWHWSPNYYWEMNFPIKGWNECLITYVLAASSPTYSIPKIVYDNGWAKNGSIINNNTYYGIRLPLGPSYGGPVFFAHYSFQGINPHNLSDAYANYWEQNRAHTLINYNYCKANPKGHFGYSDNCWGLTASDDNQVGYSAHDPTNDDSVITPTAALSSFPYTPDESMRALKFFYYTIGDKIWRTYGFTDAFSLKDGWFADSFLAIDQGPIIVMIENYRSGLLWDLFMSCPEVKKGMLKLGFKSLYL